MIAISWRGLLRSSQLCTTVARTGSFRGIVLALGENRGAREAAMKFRLTFICREPSCDKTAVVLYDARPEETVQQFRQRNPIFLAVLCGAKLAGIHCSRYNRACSSNQKHSLILYSACGKGCMEVARRTSTDTRFQVTLRKNAFLLGKSGAPKGTILELFSLSLWRV